MRFRFTGHESFPCRYTWLPKAFKAISENPTVFSDEDVAMVKLGVGKNMVKSIKFWVQAFGIATPTGNNTSLQLTELSTKLFGPNGLDPFLEDTATLWLLHWKISTINDDPLFAWYFLLNKWIEPTFTKSEIIAAFTKESARMDRPLSDFTKEQHFDIFLHTYLPRGIRKGNDVLEDSLDCPLSELQFIASAGERTIGENNKREPVYEFRQDPKTDISQSLFVYCLLDFWQNNRAQETTLSFKEISVVPGSIGQIFKLTDAELRARLDSLYADSSGIFEYYSSASVPRIVRHLELTRETNLLLLDGIYNPQRVNHRD
jgi:hypothetical protein